MIDFARLRRTITHGLPRPDLPTQNHDFWLLLNSMFDRLDVIEEDVLALLDEAEEEPTEEEPTEEEPTEEEPTEEEPTEEEPTEEEL